MNAFGVEMEARSDVARQINPRAHVEVRIEPSGDSLKAASYVETLDRYAGFRTLETHGHVMNLYGIAPLQKDDLKPPCALEPPKHGQRRNQRRRHRHFKDMARSAGRHV